MFFIADKDNKKLVIWQFIDFDKVCGAKITS